MSSKYHCLRVDRFSTVTLALLVAFLLTYPNVYLAQSLLNIMWPPLATSRLLSCRLTIPVVATITMAMFTTPPALRREAMYA